MGVMTNRASFLRGSRSVNHNREQREPH